MTEDALGGFSLLPPAEAALYYEESCRKSGLFINSTFLKQILVASSTFQFDNGYLGDNGIVPIMETLQRVPIRVLLLPKCALSREDILLLCTCFATHPLLEKVDLTGVSICVSSGKQLLQLVSRNTHISEVLLDASCPKYVAIQQQCSRNKNSEYDMMSCIVCKSVVKISAKGTGEAALLRSILKSLDLSTNAISPAGLEIMCRVLQYCCDKNEGIICLCQDTCVDSLARDVCCCILSAPKACVSGEPYDVPHLRLVRDFLERELDRLRISKMHEADRASYFCPSPEVLGNSTAPPGQPPDAIDNFFDDAEGTETGTCSICGNKGRTMANGITLLLRQLQRDITEGSVVVSPSVLHRICRIFSSVIFFEPCSRKCVRHVVRYGLYGYGGVYPSSINGHPPLSSIPNLRLSRLPLIDFTILHLSSVEVDNVHEEEIGCALAVASTMEDIEGIAMDPYFIFAAGRHLQQLKASAIGVDLATACEAVHVLGSLPVALAPFKRNEGQVPAREEVQDWDDWGKLGDVSKWAHIAFTHRRHEVYAVDGPHRNLFDNVRAALWAFRQQSRSALVVMKFCVEWLASEGGVIPERLPPKKGFYTVVKVVGQCTQNNSLYLIVQGYFGSHVGYKGFFYLPKPVFSQYAKGCAFMFVDSAYLRQRTFVTQSQPVLTATEYIPASLRSHQFMLQQLRRLLIFGSIYRTVNKLVASCVALPPELEKPFRQVMELFATLPSSLRFLRSVAEGGAMDNNVQGAELQKYLICIFTSSRYPSQVLFFLSQTADMVTRKWIQEAIELLGTLSLEGLSLRGAHLIAEAAASRASLRSSIQPENAGKWFEVCKSVLADGSWRGNSEAATCRSMRQSSHVSFLRQKKGSKKNLLRFGSSTKMGKPRETAIEMDSAAQSTSSSFCAAADRLKLAWQKKWSEDRMSMAQRQIAAQRIGILDFVRRYATVANTILASAKQSMVCNNQIANLSFTHRLSVTEGTDATRVPLRLIGKPWSTLGFLSEVDRKTASSMAVFLIWDSYCLYDVVRGVLVHHVTRLLDDPVMRHFPFASGFDLAVHHPLSKAHAFAFSSSYWCLMNVMGMECVDGPWSIASHPLFRQLPPTFYHGIDSAVAVPGSPLLLFFRECCYVLYDVENSCCVGGVGYLTSSNMVKEAAALAAARERGVSRGLLDLMESIQHKKPEPKPNVEGEVSASALRIQHTILELLTVAPLAAYEDPSRRSSQAICLVLRSGTVLSVTITPSTTTEGWEMKLAHQTTLPATTLRNLPLAFQQMTMRVVASLCDVVEEAGLTLADGIPSVSSGLRRFNPYDSSRTRACSVGSRSATSYRESADFIFNTTPSVVITSSLTNKCTGNRNLLSLSYTTESYFDSTTKSPTLLRDHVCLEVPLSTMALDTPSVKKLEQISENEELTNELMSGRNGPSSTSTAMIPASKPGVLFIEYDLGIGSCTTFAGLLLILDASSIPISLLRLAPARAVVENSSDGVVYHFQGVVVVTGEVVVTHWEKNATAARYWRLRWTHPLPSVVGIVRLFWYEQTAPSVTASVPYDILIPIPPCSAWKAEISVEAAVILQSPSALLDISNTAPVFIDNMTERGWCASHSILPLISASLTPSCLFFCGDAFSEVDLSKGEVVGNCNFINASHPAFSALPNAFLHGIDVVFYPYPEKEPHVVAMMHGQDLLFWNLQNGKPLGSTGDWRESPFLRLLPSEVHRIIAVVNNWSNLSLVTIFFTAGAELQDVWVMEWNTTLSSIHTIPVRIVEHPFFLHFVASEEPLLTVLCLPSDPSTWYFFAGTTVTTLGPSLTTAETEDIQRTPQFYALSLYLSDWGRRQHDCIITVELKPPSGVLPYLIAGMEVTSGPVAFTDMATEWQVQCSSDGLQWHQVGLHAQDTVLSRTTWIADSADENYGSHCHWRLHRRRIGTTTNHATSRSYSKLCFLTLPQRRCAQTPLRVSLAGIPTPAELSSFKTSNAGRKPVILHSVVMTSPGSNSSERVCELFLDFGESTIMLSSVSFDAVVEDENRVVCRASRLVPLRWSIASSNDAQTWSQVATFSKNGKQVVMVWLPDGKRRYWRLQCRLPNAPDLGANPLVVITNFNTSEYRGPYLLLTDSQSSLPLALPRIMHSGAAQSSTGFFFAAKDSTILLNNMWSPLVSFCLTLSSSSCFEMDLLVEYTDDVSRWWPVAQMTCRSIPDDSGATLLCQASWNCNGVHSFWRIRVLRASPPTRVRVVGFSGRVQLSCLFSTLLSSECILDVDNKSEIYPLFLTAPRAIVQVQADLDTTEGIALDFAVEYLQLDGVTWEKVAELRSHSTGQDQRPSDEAFFASWPRAAVPPSSSWRLRRLHLADAPCELASPSLQLPIRWHSFLSPHTEYIDTDNVLGMTVSHPLFSPTTSSDVENSSTTATTLIASADASEEQRATVEGEKGTERTAAVSTGAVLRYETSAETDITQSTGPCITWTFLSPVLWSKVCFVVKATVTRPVEPLATSGTTVVEAVDEDKSVDDEPAEEENGVKGEEEEEESAVVILSASIETSDNGKDYVVISDGMFAAQSTLASFSWDEVPPSCYWRLQVKKSSPEIALAGTLSISISNVKWFRLSQSSSINYVTPSQPELFSNKIYAAWITELLNHDAKFMTECRQAFDEVRSMKNKLRTGAEISAKGRTAQQISALKSKMVKYILNLSKQAARLELLKDNDPYILGMPYLSETRGTDLIYLIYRLGQSYGSNIADLVPLIGHPLAFIAPYSFTKFSPRWFYPHLEVVGRLREPFCNFTDVAASFCVYWSLSLPLQRQLDFLNSGSGFTPLNIHVASPVVVVSIPSVGWQVSEHFPGLPILYAINLTERPTTIVFALNELTFAPPYTLSIPSASSTFPTSKPLTSPYSYKIRSGVNFIQSGKLDQSPAPVLDLLKWILPAAILKNCATLMVLSVPSLKSETADFRFTVPGSGTSFGIACIEIESLEFEIHFQVQHSARNQAGIVIRAPSLDNRHFSVFSARSTTAQNTDLTEGVVWHCEAGFISHGAVMIDETELDNGEIVQNRVPVHLLGCIDTSGIPIFAVRGSLGNHRCSIRNLPGAVLTHIKWHAIIGFSSTDFGDLGGFCSGPLQVSAQLLLPKLNRTYNCKCEHDVSEKSLSVWVSLDICVDRVELDEVLALSAACAGLVEDLPGSRPSAVEICPFPVKLSSWLQVCYDNVDDATSLWMRGMGTIHWGNEEIPGASVVVDQKRRLSVSAKWVGTLAVGDVLLEATADDPITFRLTASLSRDGCGGVSVEKKCIVVGRSRLFSSTRFSTVTIEVSGTGLYLFANSEDDKLTISLQDSSLPPVCRSVQVSFDESRLQTNLYNELIRIPIVAALQGHSLPLSCTLKTIRPEKYDLSARCLIVYVSGMLYGTWFSTTGALSSPADANDFYMVLARSLALDIVEQCEGSLWAAYANVVGCVAAPEDDPLHGEKDADDPPGGKESAETVSNFISMWKRRESPSTSEETELS